MGSENAIIVQVLIALGTIATGFITVQKAVINAKKEREEENSKTLNLALMEIQRHVETLELKIKASIDENENLRESVNKEFGYVKATYNNEIKNLGEKIEGLREEVRGQHAQLVALLTTMVSER